MNGGPERSRNATFALWLGAGGMLLGFLLLFTILTPAAIVVAVRALNEISRRPALGGRWKAWMAIGLAIAAPILWVSAFLTFADQGTFGLF